MPSRERPTSDYVNHLGQPVGPSVPDWTPRQVPPRTPLTGRLCRLDPIDSATHSQDLFDAHALDAEGRNWTYLPYGPFAAVDEVTAWCRWAESQDDPIFYAIIDPASDKAIGWASYLRIDAPFGVIEVGHLAYSPLLQRTPAATEAMYLMMRHAFDDLGYRRYEWKCNALNEPSCLAAERLGFRYEGTFLQHTIQKALNRDTAWFSITDSEWPGIRTAFESWLAPANFDGSGAQRQRLGDFMPPNRRHR